MSEKRDILWSPSQARADSSTMAQFERFLVEKYGLSFVDYGAMWLWSISELEVFWKSISEYFNMRFFEPPKTVLSLKKMPGADWFPGSKVNFSDQILAHTDALSGRAAFISCSETFGRKELSWQDLQDQTASVARAFRDMGVCKGDRVVAILPNTDVALVALLACASLGAIWSICSPDMGNFAIIDRFRQIKPKILIIQDGYVHAGKTIDRSEAIDTIRMALESVEYFIRVPVTGEGIQSDVNWHDLTVKNVKFDPTPVAFDHPLWIVYSSGTTGTPKPIVHGHGGVIIEGMKQSLHHDLTTSDKFSWLTSSGWIMWNAQWVALGQGATVVTFDGSPNFPDMNRIWQFVSDEKLTFFGAGAAFYEGCIKASVKPARSFDLSALRSLGSTGSPLSGEAYDWIYSKVKSDVWLAPISGGTDFCGAFVLGHPKMPVRKGEMQCRALGNAVHSFDEEGNELVGKVGELVCTEPLPSMPIYFWGDEGNERLMESYFDTYPGVWRHGDWIEITPMGGAVIYGRSDATINRKGLRLGSAEIYQAVESLEKIRDSLVVDCEFLGKISFMPLFIVPMLGIEVDKALRDEINEVISKTVSPRFLPSEIMEVSEIPRTLSGKKLEIPVKKLLLGYDPKTVVNRDSMANPHSFDEFISYAQTRKTKD